MRSLFSARKKTEVDDLIVGLSDPQKASLLGFLREYRNAGLKPVWYASLSMMVKYRGKIVLRFSITPENNVDIYFFLCEAEDTDNILESLPDDMRQFYVDNLRRCDNCNPAHGKSVQRTILGKTYDNLCFINEMKITNPTKEQYEFLLRFTDVRKDYILVSLI